MATSLVQTTNTNFYINLFLTRFNECTFMISGLNALCSSWKVGSKVADFDKSFLCGCWSKRSKILHIVPSTPNLPKKNKYWNKMFDKSKKKINKPVWGVFSSQDWSQKKPLAKKIFLFKRDILRKHPQIAKTGIQSLKKMIFF